MVRCFVVDSRGLWACPRPGVARLIARHIPDSELEEFAKEGARHIKEQIDNNIIDNILKGE